MAGQDQLDRKNKSILLPGINPYDDLYLNKTRWWKLIDENLLNPLNFSLNKFRMDHDWDMYVSLIKDNVRPLHESLSNKYHKNTYSFYGRADEKNIPVSYLTQANVQWVGTPVGGNPNLYPKKTKLDDGRLDLTEVSFFRTVDETFSEEEKKWEIKENNRVVYAWVGQRFSLLGASENGDGTVPVCSGQIINNNIKERLSIQLEHESAYKSEMSQMFTLRSIIKIAQQVLSDKEMAFNE